MSDGSLFNVNEFDAPAEAAGRTPERPTAPTSLYRRYRPQSFDADDLFGQDHIVNTLKNAIALNRIAHAYLFCGPRGTGKTSTARILAKAVNCLDPDPANRPCNQCAACTLINSGAATDIIEIDAASNRGIDDIRDLREKVKYAPSQLRTKFYIIDEAHQITGAAANAFLKTLEEPPAHTKFILATTDPEDLLQTIVSRCQRFDFRRISLDAMVANLTKIANAEHIDIDDDAKVLIARHATGALRDAQGLLDQVAVYRENQDDTTTRVTVDLVRDVLGVSRNDRVIEIVTALADRSPAAGVKAIGEAVDAGDDVRQLARQTLEYMRELLVSLAGGQSDVDEEGKALAQRFQLGELAELTRRFGDIDFRIRHATISQLPLEIAVIEGAMRGELVAASQPTAQPMQANEERSAPAAPPERPSGRQASWASRVRRQDGNTPAPAPAPAPAPSQEQPRPTVQPTRQTNEAPAPAPDRAAAPTQRPTPAEPGGQQIDRGSGVVPFEDIVERWDRIKADVRAIDRRAEALLQEIQPGAIHGNQIVIATPYPFHKSRANADDFRRVYEQVMSHTFATKITVTCVSIDELRTQQAASAAASQQPADPPTQPATPQARPEPEPPTEDGAPTSATSDSEEPDYSRQLDAVRNIFDAEMERD